MNLSSFHIPGRALLSSLACWVAFAPSPGLANDRPFQYARTAVQEDDDQVWSFESWVQRFGSVRGLSFEPEYVFSPSTSLQVELTRFADRRDEETGHEAEIEFKHVFNNIARDGWGWGVSAALSDERLNDGEHSTRSIGLKLPFSLSLWDGEGFLHLNAGVDKANDARRTWSTSVGIEREVARHTVLFAELAHEGELKFGQVGVRHWLKKEKLAIDFSLQQQRSDGQRASGFLIGVGWYDL